MVGGGLGAHTVLVQSQEAGNAGEAIVTAVSEEAPSGETEVPMPGATPVAGTESVESSATTEVQAAGLAGGDGKNEIHTLFLCLSWSLFTCVLYHYVCMLLLHWVGEMLSYINFETISSALALTILVVLSFLLKANTTNRLLAL